MPQIGPSWVPTSWVSTGGWVDGSWGTSTPTCDYPSEDDVRFGVVYADGTKTGNLVLPAEDDVLLGIGYGADGTEYTGTLEPCPQPPTPVPPGAGQSPFAAIAALIWQRLSLVLGLDQAYILPVANRNYKITVSEPFFIYLLFSGVKSPRDPALSFENSGAGRLLRPVARHLQVYVYTRAGSDTYGSDTTALFGFDPTQTYQTPSSVPGQFAMEEAVLNALDDWTPLDGDGAPQTIGPLHVLEATDEPQRPPEDEDGLVRSCLLFEVVYGSLLSPTEPPA